MLLRTLPAIDRQEQAEQEAKNPLAIFPPHLQELIANKGRIADEVHARARNRDANSAPQGRE
jgi:hypothetical protein